MKASKTPKKLSAADREALLAALKARFEKHPKRHEGLAWTAVQARLEERPEKLWSLREMEDTGGEPDVTGHDKKTGELKDMAGYKCEKWVVKSAKEDRVITYWVANDEFSFFVPLLETLNRKDEQAVFFLDIKDAKGVFPMLGVENKLDGAEVSKLEVTKVTKAVQKPALFEIPAGYNKFERN